MKKIVSNSTTSISTQASIVLAIHFSLVLGQEEPAHSSGRSPDLNNRATSAEHSSDATLCIQLVNIMQCWICLGLSAVFVHLQATLQPVPTQTPAVMLYQICDLLLFMAYKWKIKVGGLGWVGDGANHFTAHARGLNSTWFKLGIKNYYLGFRKRLLSGFKFNDCDLF